MSETVESYFGKCLLTQVSNFYKDPIKNEAEGIAANGVVEAEKVQVIHYPDCQQLVFHMPKYAYDAGSYLLIDNATGAMIEDLQVKDRLNGGTMMLIDTLPYKPGSYTIEASWPDGWTHQICFTKLEETNPSSISVGSRQPSNDLPNNPMPVVNYVQDGRGGKIFYRNGEIAIGFDWEFAGGNAVVIIFIPEEKHWEAQTKTSPASRDEIIKHVANRAIEDKAPGCRAEIYADHISIVR
ncbi:hypothetical protein [Dyadobacter psychrophilus]|uniref:Uncharacterized protein n=1 Tax=Dyadobacter psychrophilus TaxID=651661 RepID=A0A1T5EIP5_9BACT|nr:hypothetical protein [Dyadobacter psychrophilus]SKB83638.1 hypothetical protein SAMN05660293_02483 [Dyadobacter psychrophilus]